MLHFFSPLVSHDCCSEAADTNPPLPHLHIEGIRLKQLRVLNPLRPPPPRHTSLFTTTKTMQLLTASKTKLFTHLLSWRAS